MRRFILSDLLRVGQAVYTLEDTQRHREIRAVFDRAHVADKYRKKLGRNHPRYGNGSLSSACQGGLYETSLSLSDRRFRACLRDVLDAADLVRGD